MDGDGVVNMRRLPTGTGNTKITIVITKTDGIVDGLESPSAARGSPPFAQNDNPRPFISLPVVLELLTLCRVDSFGSRAGWLFSPNHQCYNHGSDSPGCPDL